MLGVVELHDARAVRRLQTAAAVAQRLGHGLGDDAVLVQILFAAAQIRGHPGVELGVLRAAGGARDGVGLDTVAALGEEPLWGGRDEGLLVAADADHLAGRKEVAQRGAEAGQVEAALTVEPEPPTDHYLFEPLALDLPETREHQLAPVGLVRDAAAQAQVRRGQRVQRGQIQQRDEAIQPVLPALLQSGRVDARGRGQDERGLSAVRGERHLRQPEERIRQVAGRAALGLLGRGGEAQHSEA